MNKKERPQSGGSWSSRRPCEGSGGQHLAWSNSCSECGNVSPSKKLGPDRSGQMRKKHNETDGGWQQETPYKAELERKQKRRAYYAEESGVCENYLEDFLKYSQFSIWANEKVRECYSEVQLEDEGRVSIAQDVIRKGTGFLKRIIAPSHGVGGVTLSYVCLHCRCSRLIVVCLVGLRRWQQEERQMQKVKGEMEQRAGGSMKTQYMEELNLVGHSCGN